MSVFQFSLGITKKLTSLRIKSTNSLRQYGGPTREKLNLHPSKEPQSKVNKICVTYLLFIHGNPDRSESKGRRISNHCLIINDCLSFAP